MLTGPKAALFCALAAALQATDTPLVATPAGTMPVPVALAPPPGFVRLPANTVIDFEIVDALSSKTSKPDAMFAIRLVAPVTVDGTVLLPAGTGGQGQIVHAAKARALGKAGELILAARYLSCGDAHLALRGFHLGTSGKSNATELTIAIAAIGAVAAPLAFVSGSESFIPAGTRATARLSAAVDVRVPTEASCASLPVSPPSVTTDVPVVAGPVAVKP